MISKHIEITHPAGLHARVGQSFVATAKGFECDIFITKDNEQVSGKSLLKLLKLGIVQGNCIEIICEGSDEKQALDTLEAYVQEHEFSKKNAEELL